MTLVSQTALTRIANRNTEIIPLKRERSKMKLLPRAKQALSLLLLLLQVTKHRKEETRVLLTVRRNPSMKKWKRRVRKKWRR